MKDGQPETHGQQAIDHAGAGAGEHAHGHRRHRIHAQHLQAIGGGAARKRQNGTDRKVDIAAGDDIGQADRQQRHLGEVEENGEGVGQVPPVVGPEIEAREPQHRDQDDRQRIAPRQELAEALAPSAPCRWPSCLGSGRLRWRCRRFRAAAAAACRAAMPTAAPEPGA